MLIVPVVFSLVVATSATNFSYESYQVYRVQPSQKEDLAVIAAFRSNNHYDFLSPIQRDGTPVDVMVDHHAQKVFETVLERNAIKYEIYNVEREIQNERIWQLTAPRVNKDKCLPGSISSKPC